MLSEIRTESLWCIIYSWIEKLSANYSQTWFLLLYFYHFSFILLQIQVCVDFLFVCRFSSKYQLEKWNVFTLNYIHWKRKILCMCASQQKLFIQMLFRCIFSSFFLAAGYLCFLIFTSCFHFSQFVGKMENTRFFFLFQSPIAHFQQ